MGGFFVYSRIKTYQNRRTEYSPANSYVSLIATGKWNSSACNNTSGLVCALTDMKNCLLKLGQLGSRLEEDSWSLDPAGGTEEIFVERVAGAKCILEGIERSVTACQVPI